MGYLTGPQHTLADFQVEYAGLLLGPGTPYELPPTWTFLDSPPVKIMELARPWGHGSRSGPDFADVVTWQLPVGIAAAANISFTDAVTALLQKIVISRTSQPLWVKLPGFPPRGIPARVTHRSLPIDLGFQVGYVSGTVQLRAPNPIWQSLPRTVTLTPSSGGGGLNYPMFAAYNGTTGTADYGVATIAANAAIVTNNGNADAPPVAIVTGPTNGFQITVDGRSVAYSDPLQAFDVVTVDWATGRAYLSTAGSTPVDRTYLLSARDFGAQIPAGGMSTVTFTGSGGTAQITTADLWR